MTQKPTKYRDEAGRSVFGPCFGQRGALTQKGSKGVVCHLCGVAFHLLGTHVVRTHNMSCKDYRREFGLGRREALASPQLRASRRAKNGPIIKKFGPLGHARLRELWTTDPDWVERLRRKVIAAAAENGKHIEQTPRPCLVCGASITGSRWKTCGEDCLRAYRIGVAASNLNAFIDHEALDQRRQQFTRARANRWVAFRAQIEQVERVCKVCGGPFTQASNETPRKTCGSQRCRGYRANAGSLSALRGKRTPSPPEGLA